MPITVSPDASSHVIRLVLTGTLNVNEMIEATVAMVKDEGS